MDSRNGQNVDHWRKQAQMAVHKRAQPLQPRLLLVEDGIGIGDQHDVIARPRLNVDRSVGMNSSVTENLQQLRRQLFEITGRITRVEISQQSSQRFITRRLHHAPTEHVSDMEQDSLLCCRIGHRMDFQQSLITTVHDYSLGNLDAIAFNKELKQRPTALLIPCLMEEFSRPALTLIRDTLASLTELTSLVIALSADNAEDVAEAERFFADMPFPVRVHWTNGPAVGEVLSSMASLGLDLTGPPGKGWAVWQGLGVACQDAEVIGLFDADIRTFGSGYPERMLRPLLDPSHGMAYVKAFLQPPLPGNPGTSGTCHTLVCRTAAGQSRADLRPTPLPALPADLPLSPRRGVRVHPRSGHEPAHSLRLGAGNGTAV